jgi:transcriptional regulator with XRE-family HTH domain
VGGKTLEGRDEGACGATLRQKRGWTQVEMAERVGIDRSFLADVERGRRNISILNLYAIAKGFRLSLSQLLSRL